MSVSLKIFQKAYVRKDGRAAIYLQLILDREVRQIPLDIHWPPKFFQDGKCLERFKGDSEARDLNLIIGDSLAKASEILIQFRLRRRVLSADLFIEEYETGSPSTDFIKYMEAKMLQRLKEKEIKIGTYKTQLVALNHLKRWKKRLPFEMLNERTAFQFDAYLDKIPEIKTINGKFGRHRDFKTYLNQAKSDRIEFLNPYDYFRIKSTMGRFQPLHKSELIKLWDHYLENQLKQSDRDSLRGFLFVCLTGMRHGDLRRFTMDWLDGDFFEFVPEKTSGHGTAVRVPTSSYAMRLLADEVAEKGKKGFFKSITEQKQNEAVRAIGESLELSTSLCYQVGRETFATLYMEQEGKLEVLASFMGHTTTKMSEKYVKIRDQRKREESARISSFLEKEKVSFGSS
jgi:integrase/recombinase XerD